MAKICAQLFQSKYNTQQAYNPKQIPESTIQSNIDTFLVKAKIKAKYEEKNTLYISEAKAQDALLSKTGEVISSTLKCCASFLYIQGW